MSYKASGRRELVRGKEKEIARPTWWLMGWPGWTVLGGRTEKEEGW
jgi:hypothetical protein